MHADTQYRMVTQRIADDHRQAEMERLVRRARDEQRARRVHTVTVRARIARLVGRARRPRVAFPLTTVAALALSLVPVGPVGASDPATGPTFAQRHAFLMEEHGYPAGPADGLLGTTVIPAGVGPARAQQVPTFAQRHAFLMEEHGYPSGGQSRPVSGSAPVFETLGPGR